MKPLILCHVQVRQHNGYRHTYTGLFRSTVDAASDAFVRFCPGTAVKVTANKNKESRA